VVLLFHAAISAETPLIALQMCKTEPNVGFISSRNAFFCLRMFLPRATHTHRAAAAAASPLLGALSLMSTGKACCRC
jgi:hypothetical protein